MERQTHTATKVGPSLRSSYSPESRPGEPCSTKVRKRVDWQSFSGTEKGKSANGEDPSAAEEVLLKSCTTSPSEISDISWPGTNNHTLDRAHGQICESSGCEDRDLSQGYEWKLSSSPSRSPSPTVSPSPSPTSSRSESPPRNRPRTATASCQSIASQQLSANGKFGDSRPFDSPNLFEATATFGFSEIFDSSDSADAAGV
jgi:hypothetical protein